MAQGVKADREPSDTVCVKRRDGLYGMSRFTLFSRRAGLALFQPSSISHYSYTVKKSMDIQKRKNESRLDIYENQHKPARKHEKEEQWRQDRRQTANKPHG